jgi:hypothetical protein
MCRGSSLLWTFVRRASIGACAANVHSFLPLPPPPDTGLAVKCSAVLMYFARPYAKASAVRSDSAQRATSAQARAGPREATRPLEVPRRPDATLTTKRCARPVVEKVHSTLQTRLRTLTLNCRHSWKGCHVCGDTMERHDSLLISSVGMVMHCASSFGFAMRLITTCASCLPISSGNSRIVVRAG